MVSECKGGKVNTTYANNEESVYISSVRCDCEFEEGNEVTKLL